MTVCPCCGHDSCMITDRLDREKEWCRKAEWCGQEALGYTYRYTDGFVRRMRTPIFTARGKWSMPYKGYFENGHSKAMPGTVRSYVTVIPHEPEAKT